MPSKFAAGDIVQLRSGDPKMTVKRIAEAMDDEQINCQWFSGSKLQDGWFNPESLVKVKKMTKKTSAVTPLEVAQFMAAPSLPAK